MPKARYLLGQFMILVLASYLLSGCAGLKSQPRADYTAEITDMDFVFVKGGSFQMGSMERPDERPVHTVTVGDLFVGMYEVTFAQYDHYCQTAPRCEPPSDLRWGRGAPPTISVSWHDANAYARWLSEQTGQTFRLPTEAEWEYFARAGTATPYWSGKRCPREQQTARIAAANGTTG
jgi:formylglycine-generating enzyme required for sulfatase activity